MSRKERLQILAPPLLFCSLLLFLFATSLCGPCRGDKMHLVECCAGMFFAPCSKLLQFTLCSRQLMMQSSPPKSGKPVVLAASIRLQSRVAGQVHATSPEKLRGHNPPRAWQRTGGSTAQALHNTAEALSPMPLNSRTQPQYLSLHHSSPPKPNLCTEVPEKTSL